MHRLKKSPTRPQNDRTLSLSQINKIAATISSHREYLYAKISGMVVKILRANNFNYLKKMNKVVIVDHMINAKLLTSGCVQAPVYSASNILPPLVLATIHIYPVLS